MVHLRHSSRNRPTLPFMMKCCSSASIDLENAIDWSNSVSSRLTNMCLFSWRTALCPNWCIKIYQRWHVTVSFVNTFILYSMTTPKNDRSRTKLALCSLYYFHCAVDYLMWHAETAQKRVFSFRVIKAPFKACCTIYCTSAYHPDTATQATSSLSAFFSFV